MGPVIRRSQLGFALSLFALVGLSLSTPVAADDVSVGGDVTFASLDGSAADHDGVADGVFTVDDGSLFVTGTIRCDDEGPASASACPMVFDVSGDLVVEAGGALRAQNHTGPGDGGDVELWVGGDLILAGAAGPFPGAVVTSGRTSSPAGAAGVIRVTTGGAVTIGAGATVSASTPGGAAGEIEIDAAGPLTLDGRVFSGPGDTLTAAPSFGEALVGGSGTQRGGTIALRSAAEVAIGGSAYVVSQGHDPGADRILVEGCGVAIRGLVASLSRDGGPSRVVVRSGEGILVDGRDLDGEAPASGRFGQLRAGGTTKGAGGYSVHLFAASDVTVLGPSGTAAPFAVSSDQGDHPHGQGGSVVAVSTGGSIAATGRAARAGVSGNGHDGGWIDLRAAKDVIVDGAILHANGNLGSGASGAGGAIILRAHQGEISWVLGEGDARPVGTGTPAVDQGSIILVYCTTVDTAGTSFPTTGSPIPPYPILVQACSPPAPSLPPGEPPLPVCNQPPTADDQAVTTDEDTPVTIVLTASDPDGDSLTFTIVDPPDHGDLGPIVPTGPASAEVEYTPDADYFGPDELTFQVDDGNGGTDNGTVTITVDPVNDAPVAVDDSATVAEGGTVGVLDSAEASVLANDTDADDDPLTAILVSGPAHASAFTLNADGTFSYTHDGGTDASDAFSYRANDGTVDSNVATVTITITQLDDPPVATDDAYAVDEGGTLVEPAPGVLGNDTDDEGATLTAILVSGPAHASSFTLNADGSFSYTHDGSETTSDAFTYQANDGTNGSNTATVTITVNAVDDPPVAADDANAVDEGATLNEPAPGVLGNDTDAEGSSLAAILVSGPSHASSFTLNPDGSFDYTHDGTETTSDSFTYMANDGSLDSNVATVSITVDAVNDAPVADDDAYAVDEGGTLAEPAPGVLANDTDAEGDSLTAVLVSGPAHASSFMLNADGSFSYTHDGSETTSDSFTYMANDGTDDSNVATVTITVTAVDDPPVAVADFPMVFEDSGATALLVLTNDTDVDGGPKEITTFSDPANGTVVGVGGGPFTDVTYEPDPNYCNSPAGPSATPDTFTYTLNGGSMATVSVTVICINDPPVFADATIDYTTAGNTQLRAGEAATGNSVAHVADNLDAGEKSVPSDPDGPGIFSYSLGTAPANGMATVNADGTFTYEPNAGFHGPTDTFTIDVSDGGAPPAVSSITVTVTILEMVWYVHDVTGANNPAAGDDGRSTNAFDSIAELVAADPVTADDYIFVFAGDTAATPHATELVINDSGVKLHGEGVGLTVPGVGTLVPAGTKPRWVVTTDVALEEDNAVTVDATAGSLTGVEIRGLDLTGRDNAVDVTATGAFNAGVTISDNTIANHATAGLEGVDVNAGGTGTVTVAVSNNVLSGRGNAFDARTTVAGAALRVNLSGNADILSSLGSGVVIDGSLGGTTTVTGFANNSVHQSTGGSGILVTSATFDGTPGGSYQQVSGGNTRVGTPGDAVGASGVLLTNVAGDLAFTDLDIFAGAGDPTGAGLRVTGTGAVDTGAGTGTRVTVTPNAGIIQTTTVRGVDVQNATLDLQLVDLDVASASTTAVWLVNVADGGGTNAVFTAPSGSSITTTLGAAAAIFNVSGGNAKITYAGTLTNSGTGRAVAINGWSGDDAGDDALFSGAITENGAGILLNGNGGTRSITFSGGMTINTGTGQGFAATSNTNSGGLHITGTNTINSTSATALRVTSTTIGSSGLTFRSISSGNDTAAAEPTNGIVLSNTGSLAGLTVTGNGGSCTEGSSTCTGGWIRNIVGGDDSGTTPVGTGIVLNNTANISLTRMRINGTSNYGIRGTNVAGFSFTSGVIDGANGTNASSPFNDGSVIFNGLTGTSSITGSTIRGGHQRNINVDNSSGTLNLTVSGNTIKRTSDAAGDDGFHLEADTNANVTLAVTGNTFARHGGDHVNLSLVNSAVVDATITGNTLHGNYAGTPEGNHPIGLGQGIFILGATFNGTFTYEVSGNGTVAVPFRGNRQGGAIHVNKGSGTGTFSGSIENNVIGDPAITASGSSEAFGIIVGARGAGGSHTTLINNNQVREYFDRGIVLEAGEGSAALNATVTNNTVSDFADAINSLHGIHSDNGILVGDTNAVCLHVSGNSVAAAGNEAGGGSDLRLRRGSSTTVRLPGLVGSTNADATNLLQANNPTATSISVTGGSFSGGAACPLP